MIIDSCNTFFPLILIFWFCCQFGEAKLREKNVRQHVRPGMKRSWFREMWLEQKCWWNLITLSDALTCILHYFLPSACRDKNKHCKSWASTGECGKNPNYMLFNCSESCKVCPGMHDAQEVKPITFKNFVIIDPCNAFFSLSCAYILILLPIHIHQ